MGSKFRHTLASFLFGLRHPFNAGAAAGAYQGALEGPWGALPKGYDHQQEAQKAAARHGAPENFNSDAAFAGAFLGVITGTSAIYSLFTKKHAKRNVAMTTMPEPPGAASATSLVQSKHAQNDFSAAARPAETKITNHVILLVVVPSTKQKAIIPPALGQDKQSVEKPNRSNEHRLSL